MPLFKLTTINSAFSEHHCPYDCYDGRVIRADSEKRCREIANQSVGDEGKIWEDPQRVSCQIITDDGPEEIILSDFRAG
jgi:hypothetical protein